MYVMRSVRCHGCPPPVDPWPFGRFLRQDPLVFEGVCVERRFPGAEIRGPGADGWAWFELDRIDPKRGGAPRAHVDALRLMAVILAHWDNKSENQRLVCLPGGPDGGSCARPFALMQDLGASFGPFKMNAVRWRRFPVWADPQGCRVSMKSLPFDGGTFPDAIISEAGRAFLAERLGQISEGQIRDLFLGARFPDYRGMKATGPSVEMWVDALRAKIREVAERTGCPV
jgi:hypothetical protein